MISLVLAWFQLFFNDITAGILSTETSDFPEQIIFKYM